MSESRRHCQLAAPPDINRSVGSAASTSAHMTGVQRAAVAELRGHTRLPGSFMEWEVLLPLQMDRRCRIARVAFNSIRLPHRFHI